MIPDPEAAGPNLLDACAPVRAILNRVGDTQQQVEPNENEIAAILGTANWGPKGIETGGTALYQSWPAFIADYGSDLSSPGVLAVYQAFRGQDVAGAGGAGGVYFHRLAGSAAAAARVTQLRNNPIEILPRRRHARLAVPSLTKHSGDIQCFAFSSPTFENAADGTVICVPL